MLIISSYCRIPLLGFILSPSTPKDDKNLSIYINACQVGDHGEAHDAADEAQDPQEKPCQSTAPPAKKRVGYSPDVCLGYNLYISFTTGLM